MESMLYLLAGILIVVGALGTVLPAIPGTPLVFVGMLIAASVADFSLISVWTIVVLGFLTALSLAIDLVSAAAGAKKVGASKWAVIGAAVGTVLGLTAGIVGLVFGPFAGAAAGEFLATANVRRAGSVGFATWLGLLVGTALKVGVTFAMLGVFLGALLI